MSTFMTYPSHSPPVWPFPRQGPLPLSDDAQTLIGLLDALSVAILVACEQGFDRRYPRVIGLRNLAVSLRKRIAASRSMCFEESLAQLVDEVDEACAVGGAVAAPLAELRDQLHLHLRS
jgi:hypothetical protein